MNKEESRKYHHAYHKVWYQKNRERRLQQLKEYAQNHREDSVKRTQKYVTNHKEKVRAYNKRFEQSFEGKYRMLIYRAKHFAGTPITLEKFIELSSMPCAYCGDNGKVGIDRIDNSKGYTTENSTAACKTCNFMKKTTSVKDFISHIKKIFKYNEKSTN